MDLTINNLITHNDLTMGLSARQIQAFVTIAQTLHFTEAAELLTITQSALSQRINQLEKKLDANLIKRSSRGAILTESGLRLLQYCKFKHRLEKALLDDLKYTPHQSSTTRVSIGAYSSVLRSVIIPSLSQKKSLNSFNFNYLNIDLIQLPKLFVKGELDLAITQNFIDERGVVSQQIGTEKYCFMQSNKMNATQSILQQTSCSKLVEGWLSQQNLDSVTASPKILYNDIYCLLDSASNGNGMALIPEHLVNKSHDLVTISSFNRLEVPIFLSYYEHFGLIPKNKRVIEHICQDSHKYLAPRSG